jgi:peptidoglycan/xylan/chitin deacetylase (PgdA/CDA1 family)
MTPVPARRGAVVFFYDYDTQWGADQSRSPGGPKKWGHRDFENTEALLELHARYDVPACFAVVGAAALPGPRPYHDPHQIRRIHAAGHEVGSHSFHHDWLPGLNSAALRETLRRSKQALEDCIGAPVTSFVPPFNQPFDYPAGLAVSMAERREAGRSRTGLSALCRALADEGYRFCRVAYRPLPIRLAEMVLRRRIERPSTLKNIAGVACVRINTQVGFADSARRMLQAASERGGIAVAHAHPHSVRTGGPQDVRYLETLLQEVARLRRDGAIDVVLPGELTGARKTEFRATRSTA